MNEKSGDMAETGEGRERVYSDQFKVFDLNSDGQIDFQELLKGLKMLKLEGDPTKIKKLFTKLDSNNDGFIDPNEFLKLLYND